MHALAVINRGGVPLKSLLAKAQRYMEVAETERIPIHFYVFTPGSYPVEEYPGAAQQIARNIYTMTKLRVPTVSFISEGGSGSPTIG